jgi:orotate phosphoribosyltransferase
VIILHSSLKDKIVSQGIVKKGFFKLSSGLFSEYYLQCAKIFEDPIFSSEVCEVLTDKINHKFGKNFFDIVVSPAMGGLLFGYEMSRHLGIKNIFLERGDGKTFELKRGFDILPNSKILICEDVITTAKSSLEVVDILKKYNPHFIAEVCVFNRGGAKNLPFDVISLEKVDIKTFDGNHIPEYLKNQTPVKPGSRKI